ncbi:Flocculation suppression protein [Penicillium digitatum PHI26]|uniref:Flocculation suppression protein n=3 Tax=Penicillium digitatum TaxID=36651 RepID=K9GMP3_PEND2|nr:Flocculation suppression protein [Penicillium digitatum Pd1]EKV15978.1 Flocculation suppression protein [Penicillium digitatum PHI26]EKV20490.1 Flocculation suppression protein [Penicillium digitatum Pd1]
MDITPPPTGAHGTDDRMTGITNGAEAGNNHLNAPNLAIGAAAAAQQPKVVQTAFIHKLYNMLEDPSIQHLISWSGTNDSFVMSPTSEFSKVLASYFKHTNISSFVRQLNMYGFHKVSDVFHTGSPDSALWEFKHGNGNFKRGDLAGLREIKRRASRHALIHRDSFPSHKAASQPGTPAEPVADATEARILTLEANYYELHARMARAEEGNITLNSRCHAMTDSLTKCYQWTHSISRFLQAIVPDRESPLHRDVSSMQREVEKHVEIMRAIETSHETLMPPRQQYFASITEAGPPLSPRQMPQDDARRQSMMDHTPRPTNMIRPPVPPHLSVSPRRYGSIGGANSASAYARPQPPVAPPPQQPMPHPLSVSTSPGPNLARRHTSADIRQHGWSPSAGSPYPPGNPPNGPWPSSPGHPTPVSSDQQVRDVLAQYEMGAPRRLQEQSRHATPPTAEPSPSMLGVDNGWTLGSKFPHGSSLPETRRSSMASNVHSLLNPADTAERPDEDQQVMVEDRKRKRLE